MRPLLFTLLLLANFGFVACSQNTKSTEQKSTKPTYELAAPKEFMQGMTNAPGIVLDVRTPSEQRKGIIKGAVCIDIFADNFEQSLQNLDKNKTYYVYCAAGGRSLEACETMQKIGFVHVVDLDGGITRWRNEGFPVEPGKQ